MLAGFSRRLTAESKSAHANSAQLGRSFKFTGALPVCLPPGSYYSYFGAYMKFGQPPGWRYGEYDLRPIWKFGGQEDSDLEIQLDRQTEGYQIGRSNPFRIIIISPFAHALTPQLPCPCTICHGVCPYAEGNPDTLLMILLPSHQTFVLYLEKHIRRLCDLFLGSQWNGRVAGEWYLGVNGEDAGTCKYTLTISKFDCPMNCTSQGTCQHQANGTHTCLCNKVRCPLSSCPQSLL